MRVLVKEKNNIYHQCKCGNRNIDMLSAKEKVIHEQDRDIPIVEITHICSDCGSVMVEQGYLYKNHKEIDS